MRATRRILPAVVLAALAGAAVPSAGAAQFSNVVVFGDSLSDSGYYRPFLAGIGLPSSLVSTLGRFTTNPGPVWAEIVGQYYGANTAPSNAGGWNFAQGGATVATSSPSTPPGFAQRPVSTQINEYLTRNGGAADPNALHAVWAGGNDFLNNYSLFASGAITQAQFQTNLLGAATAEAGQVGRLMGAGARYVMVFALPDIGSTPFAQAAGAAAVGAATQASAGYNTTLYTSLAGAGLRVIPVDVFSLLNEIRANPSAYGITNTTGMACGPFPPITTTPSAQFCYSGNLVAPGADQSYLFADGVHPTTAAHRVVGDFAKSLVEGPESYSMYGEVPLRTRAAHVQTLADGVAIGQASPGTFGAFASMAGGNFDVEAQGTSPTFDSNNRAITVGVTMRASESVVLGAAFGQTKSEGTFGQERGGFRTTENTGSVFFNAKAGGFYATGAASLANLDFTDSRRVIPLGSARRVAEASPSGTNASGSIYAGYDWNVDKFAVGPVVSWTSQEVAINGFDETGAGSANLRIAKQKRRSEVVSGGVRGSWNLGSFTPYARFTFDTELKDDVRYITASPLSIVGGPSYDIPAIQPGDSSWGTIVVGVRGTMNQSIGYGLSYTKVTGRSGISEDYLQGTLSVKF